MQLNLKDRWILPIPMSWSDNRNWEMIGVNIKRIKSIRKLLNSKYDGTTKNQRLE